MKLYKNHRDGVALSYLEPNGHNILAATNLALAFMPFSLRQRYIVFNIPTSEFSTQERLRIGIRLSKFTSPATSELLPGEYCRHQLRCTAGVPMRARFLALPVRISRSRLGLQQRQPRFMTTLTSRVGSIHAYLEPLSSLTAETQAYHMPLEESTTARCFNHSNFTHRQSTVVIPQSNISLASI